MNNGGRIERETGRGLEGCKKHFGLLRGFGQVAMCGLLLRVFATRVVRVSTREAG